MTRGPSATDTLHVSATAVTAVATADNVGWSLYGASVANPRTGAELARAEDEIDAYICAYIAFYYWTHGTTRCRVAGDVTDGYILTPVTPELAARLDRVTSEPVDERPERVVARRGLTLVERNAARVEAASRRRCRRRHAARRGGRR